MKTKRTAVAILGFLSLVFSSRSAAAFCRATTADRTVPIGADGCMMGSPLYWKSQCVGIHLDEAASQYLSLDDARRSLGEASAKWMAAGGQCLPSIYILQLAPVASPKLGYDAAAPDENDIVFRDQDWPYELNGIEKLELVDTIFKKATGELLDADVEINGTQLPHLLQLSDGGAVDPASAPRLKRLFLHLVGHFLGFGHSPSPDSVMYAQLDLSDTSEPELTDDDAAGMCAAYPPDGTRPTLDAKGEPISVQATACTLGAATPASACSSSSLHIDHGCSLAAPRSASHDRGPALVIASVAFYLSRRRRERAVSAMA